MHKLNNFKRQTTLRLTNSMQEGFYNLLAGGCIEKFKAIRKGIKSKIPSEIQNNRGNDTSGEESSIDIIEICNASLNNALNELHSLRPENDSAGEKTSQTSESEELFWGSLDKIRQSYRTCIDHLKKLGGDIKWTFADGKWTVEFVGLFKNAKHADLLLEAAELFAKDPRNKDEIPLFLELCKNLTGLAPPVKN